MSADLTVSQNVGKRGLQLAPSTSSTLTPGMLSNNFQKMFGSTKNFLISSTLDQRHRYNVLAFKNINAFYSIFFNF